MTACVASPPRAPAGLRRRGRPFWRRVVADFDLSTSELMLLEEACRTLDDLDALREAATHRGRDSRRAAGQPRAHPALVELRQQRVALGRILSQLALPDGADESLPTLTQVRAKRAADARWRPHRAKAAGRG